METQKKSYSMEHKLKHFVTGIVVVLAGILLIFRNTGNLSPFATDIIFSWQMLLIAIGVINLFGKGKVFAILAIVVGSAYLIPEFYDLDFDFTSVFWPALLILGGAMIILKGGRKMRHFKEHVTVVHGGNDDFLEDVIVFGGSERIITSQQFKGGKIITIFGGLKMDLSQAKLAEGPQILEVVSVFGGIETRLPSDWRVKTEVVSIMGGFADKRRNVSVSTDENKMLIVKGVAIFGGGEIKSAF